MEFSIRFSTPLNTESCGEEQDKLRASRKVNGWWCQPFSPATKLGHDPGWRYVGGLDFFDVLRLRSFGTLLGLEFNPVALRQRTEAAACYRGVMDEDILAAVVRCDETEAFTVIEPLNNSLH
jgi:hypothetical protein